MKAYDIKRIFIDYLKLYDISRLYEILGYN